MIEVKILYEDAQLIVCVKPPGMPSQAERSSTMDLASWLKNYLALKQGNGARGKSPYIGVVHRLDRPVGGIMVYAKTPKAAAGLSRQFSEHRAEKDYLALLTGRLPEPSGTLVDHLEKDGRTNTSAVVAKGGKKAGLDYRELEEKDGLSLVEVRLHTGRHHQIRVQMAHAGAGIYGDMKYNGEGTKKRNEKEGIGSGNPELCLFSCRLTFKHPVSHQKMCFEVLPEQGRMTIDEWPSLSYYKKRK
ncbi:RluA family pseudouridine synthase [Frisingicoccus sp.]|uniref:RluA family pseudouridine synthase n=1 Tax=Frisingicoccus sp. TaxID=1918627 RepID=UPI003AB6EC7D